MEAVARAGFEQLGRMISEARDRHPDKPVRQLRDAGVAYVLWATQNPERTRLMFGGMMKSDQIDEVLHQSAEAAYNEIYGIIDCGRNDGIFGGQSTDEVVLSCWSAVHGLTMLILGSGKLSPAGETEIRALAESVCDTILNGIQAHAGETDQ
jgi:AcrR family transcriptional regulator